MEVSVCTLARRRGDRLAGTYASLRNMAAGERTSPQPINPAEMSPFFAHFSTVCPDRDRHRSSAIFDPHQHASLSSPPSCPPIFTYLLCLSLRESRFFRSSHRPGDKRSSRRHSIDRRGKIENDLPESGMWIREKNGDAVALLSLRNATGIFRPYIYVARECRI